MAALFPASEMGCSNSALGSRDRPAWQFHRQWILHFWSKAYRQTSNLLDETLFRNLGPTLQTPGRHFQEIIRHARIGVCQPIQDIFERKLGIFVTGFAPSNQAFRF
jgi:hypothetical protein